MTIQTTYTAIFDQLEALCARLSLEPAALGRAASALLRHQPVEAPFDADGEAMDGVVRLLWAMVIRETAVDHAGLVLGSMRLELLGAGEQSLAEVRGDLLASAALHPRWVLGREDVRLPASWVHSANAVEEVLAWRGVDLRLLLVQPLSDWKGVSEELEALRASASEAALRLLERGDVVRDYLAPVGGEGWVTRALTLHGQGRSAEASRDLAKAREAGVAEGRVLSLQAMMHREDGALAEALEAYDAALAAGVENLAEVHFDRALTLGLLGDQDGALAGYDAALALRPTWTAPLLNKAVLWSERGESEAARSVLEQAISQDAEDAELHYNLSLALLALGRTVEALAALDRAITLDPTSAAAHNNRGVLRRQTGELAGALEDFAAALEAQEHSRTRVNRAGVALELGRWDVALTDAEVLLGAYPAAAAAHIIKAQACEGLSRKAQAVSSYVAALRHASEGEDAIATAEAGLARLGYAGPATWPLPQSPAVAPVRRYLESLAPELYDAVVLAMSEANGAMMEQAPADALVALDAGIVVAADYFELWLQRASVHVMLGDLDAAATDNARGLDLCPTADMGWAQRADLAAARGDLDGALEAMSRAVALFPTQVAHLMKRSYLRGLAEDLEGSTADLRAVLALDPAHEDALYNLAHALQGQGAYAEAIEVYGQALSARPDDVQALLNRGTARVALSDTDGALADFDAAIVAAPDYAFAYAKRGLVLSILGELWAAAFDLLMALLIAPEDWPMSEPTRESFAGVLGEVRDAGQVPTEAQLAAIVERTLDLGVAQRALPVLEAFEEDLGGLAEFWSLCGRLMALDERAEDAEAAWRRALSLDARCASAGYHLGTWLAECGDAETALPSLQEAIADRRAWDTWSLAAAHYRCGEAALALKRPEVAIVAFEQAVAADATMMEAHFKLGFARDLAGDVEGALVAYSAAIALEPGESTPWFNRACEHARAGQREAALSDLAEAISREPAWSMAAWQDDYFAPLWEDAAFVAVAGPRPGDASS